MTHRRRIALAAPALAAVLAATAPAAAVAQAPKPFLDVRGDGRDPVLLGRPGAPLAGREAGGPVEVAERYVREHRARLGLRAADLGSLRPAGVVDGEVRFRQYAGAIPSFDGGLRVEVRDGRVLSVTGAPQRRLSLARTTPALPAAAALRRLMGDVGVRRPVEVVEGPVGARRRTRFATGDEAALVAFGDGAGARLAWKLSYRASPLAWYAAVVDAESGEVLYRSNRVKALDTALVWEQHPGAASGGEPQARELTPYLEPGAETLTGPYARVWSDLNDDFFPFPGGEPEVPGEPDDGEAVPRNEDGTFAYPFVPFDHAAGGCASFAPCSWNVEEPGSWIANREQSAVQAFYLVNRFRDHLAAPPISFTGEGAFEGEDAVDVNVHDGAAVAGGLPDADHLNNAFMATPPDGEPPVMGLFLWQKSSRAPFRDVNVADDAAFVYHEYAHGLSSRLVTLPDGEQALDSDEAAAMGEGWSDWYAKDFIAGQFPEIDDPAVPGEVDMGAYTDSVPHSARNQALDCPVGAPTAACPAAGLAGPGGFTYDDFCRISGQGAEVHADGEIWAQTLWDLREALGVGAARRVVTEGMRRTPPQPTFLDGRDAILLAAGSPEEAATIREVFAGRGMGPDAGGWSGTGCFDRAATGPLVATPDRVPAGEEVRFDASGVIGDEGRTVSYRWDFQGDGTVDAVTSAPQAAFTYGAPGTYAPRVVVRFPDTGTASAATAVDVAARPAPPPPPPPPAAVPPAPPPPSSVRPGLALPRSGTRGRVRFHVTCDSPCTGRARLTVSRAVARRLGLGRRRTVASARVRLAAAGRRTFAVRLSRRALRGMRRAGVRRVAVALRVSVADGQGERTTARRRVRVRR